MSRTADVLGVERSNLYRKMRAFGIARAGSPPVGRGRRRASESDATSSSGRRRSTTNAHRAPCTASAHDATSSPPSCNFRHSENSGKPHDPHSA